MGMDIFMYAAHSKKEFEDNHSNDVYYTHSEADKWACRGEIWHAYKFYALHDFIQNSIFHEDYKCNEYIELKKENLADIISFCCFNRNYSGDFSSLPSLCEIYDHWQELEEHGLKVFYECDW